MREKMRTNKLIILIFFLCLVALNGNSREKNSFHPFFVIQVTDPQFGMIEADKGFGKETELYEKAVKSINKLNPDFIVITGDLVNRKNDLTQIAEFKRITSLIKPEIPVYYSPGNHDIGESPEKPDIDSFIANYGQDRFAFIHNGTLFIGLNSCLIKSNVPEYEQLQYEWLNKKLSKGRSAKHIIIFCHYPFFIKSFDEADSYSNIPKEIREKYLSLFKKKKVNAVFAGHLHNNGSAKSGDLEMITTSSVGKPLGNAPSGIRIIKVYPDRIESSYFGLDEIPETIVFN
jgi:serine/threonine-protein phosphatase CPPED1